MSSSPAKYNVYRASDDSLISSGVYLSTNVRLYNEDGTKYYKFTSAGGGSGTAETGTFLVR